MPLLFASAVLALATSVRPPSFGELVDGSELVFRGEVLSVEASWQGEGARRHVATQVRFRIERVVKGSAADEITLEFFGGRVGGRQLHVAGLPRFAPGDRVVCFVENRHGHLCPIRRLRHGRYRIAEDAATRTERVLRDDGEPLADAAGVQAPLADDARGALSLGAGVAMPLAEFERQIAERAGNSAPASTR